MSAADPKSVYAACSNPSSDTSPISCKINASLVSNYNGRPVGTVDCVASGTMYGTSSGTSDGTVHFWRADIDDCKYTSQNGTEFAPDIEYQISNLAGATHLMGTFSDSTPGY